MGEWPQDHHSEEVVEAGLRFQVLMQYEHDAQIRKNMMKPMIALRS